MLTILTLKMLLMIVYLAHWDWILTQSRKDIVSNINDSKFMAICPIEDRKEELNSIYQSTKNWKLKRDRIFDLKGILNLRKILEELTRDDIVHVFTLKSGLLLCFANIFKKRKKTKNILTITGLGYLFSENSIAKILKFILSFFIDKLINKNFNELIFQNLNDQKLFLEYSNFKNRNTIIPTSGINTEDYLVKPKKDYEDKKLKVIMATRLLEDKGVLKYVELAKITSQPDIEFYLAGDIDEGNPNSLSQNQLQRIKDLEYINFLGQINIKRKLKDFDVNIVMSEYEGSSRILLEAVYVGLICISNNIPGTSTLDVGYPHRTNILIENNDVDRFKKELLKIFNSHNEYLNSTEKFGWDSQKIFKRDQARNDRIVIKHKFTSVKVAEKYNKIYKGYQRSGIGKKWKDSSDVGE